MPINVFNIIVTLTLFEAVSPKLKKCKESFERGPSQCAVIIYIVHRCVKDTPNETVVTK